MVKEKGMEHLDERVATSEMRCGDHHDRSEYWKENTIPEEWKHTLVIIWHKKGRSHEYSSHRPGAFQSIAYKTYTDVRNETEHMEEKQMACRSILSMNPLKLPFLIELIYKLMHFIFLATL